MDKAFEAKEQDGWVLKSKIRGVECFLKEEEGLTFTMGVGTIRATPEQVVELASNANRRKDYDGMWKRDTSLLSMDLDLLHQALGTDIPCPVEAGVKNSEYKSPFPLVIGARDLIIASCKIELASRVTVYMVSAPDGLQPPTNKYAGYEHGDFELRHIGVWYDDNYEMRIQLFDFGQAKPVNRDDKQAMEDYIHSCLTKLHKFM